MLNQSVFIGRLTKEPELQTVGEKQISVVKFILAVDRPRYGDAKPQADFIPVTAWRTTAEFAARNFSKGKQVYVTGRLQTRSWEDNNGARHFGFEIVANEVGFADAPQRQGKQPDDANSEDDFPYGVDECPEDDLPF